MNFNHFKTVLKKELKDLLRDKKSIIATFIIPLVIYPLMMFFIGGGISEMTESTEDISVAVTGVMTDGVYSQLNSEDKKVILNVFESYNENLADSQSKITVKDYPDLNKALVDGDIKTIITVESGIKNVFNDSQSSYKIGYVIDYRSNSSSIAVSTIKSVISSFSDLIFSERFSEVTGEDISDYTVINSGGEYNVDNFYSRSGTGNQLILMIMPMLVTILISVGGATIAVDLIAGEKERGTFEPLLSTSASRFSILLAKYMVVLIFAFVNGVIQVLAMGIGIAFSPGMNESISSGALTLSFGGIVLGALNILLLASFFCSIMLCLASTAKTFKEASTKTSFLVFLPIILSYSVMFKDAVNIGLSNMFIPIINVVCVIKMIMSGYINYMYFTVSIIVNVILLAIAVYITLKMFSKESLITRG